MKNKYFSIVIPYYDETPCELNPILSAINNQVGLDMNLVEIILVNDGNKNEMPDTFLNSFHNLDIKVILMEENKGPGAARQTGVDSAMGKYVMFCDADDTLHNVMVLAMLMKELMNSQPDMLISSWLEEQKLSDGWMYTQHDDDRTWMFGKVFSVPFIRGNDIRFHEDLRVQEDSYFNSLAIEISRNTRVIDQITYIWKYREKSITRCNDYLYSFSSYSEYIKSVTNAIGELEQRGIVENLPYKTTQLIIYSNFVLHQAQWQKEEVSGYLKDAEKILKERIRPYLHYFREMTEEAVREIYSRERSRHFVNEIERELFSDWIERIGLTEYKS